VGADRRETREIKAVLYELHSWQLRPSWPTQNYDSASPYTIFQDSDQPSSIGSREGAIAVSAEAFSTRFAWVHGVTVDEVTIASLLQRELEVAGIQSRGLQYLRRAGQTIVPTEIIELAVVPTVRDVELTLSVDSVNARKCEPIEIQESRRALKRALEHLSP
jgi:hypothetical protein